jgi:hypothetical protein
MSEETVEEEVLLSFKRFSAEKQDQVRALVNYATLMGLDGKDLVSIGGKLDRIKQKRERDRLRIVADELIKSCAPIGNDKKKQHHNNDLRRWNYVDGSGRKWTFTEADYWHVKVTSDTGVTKNFRNLDTYDVGRTGGKWTMKQVMLNVYEHKIMLNF